MNGKDFTIGVLSVTGLVLLVGFLILQAIPPQPVLASGQSGTVGDYVVTTSFVDDQCEVISIADAGSQRLNFYQLDSATGQLVILQSMDLRHLITAPGQQPKVPPRLPGRRR